MINVSVPGHIHDHGLCRQACWYENCVFIDDEHYRVECGLECDRECGVRAACMDLARMCCGENIMCLWGFMEECRKHLHSLLDKLHDSEKLLKEKTKT